MLYNLYCSSVFFPSDVILKIIETIDTIVKCRLARLTLFQALSHWDQLTWQMCDPKVKPFRAGDLNQKGRGNLRSQGLLESPEELKGYRDGCKNERKVIQYFSPLQKRSYFQKTRSR